MLKNLLAYIPRFILFFLICATINQTKCQTAWHVPLIIGPNTEVEFKVDLPRDTTIKEVVLTVSQGQKSYVEKSVTRNVTIKLSGNQWVLGATEFPASMLSNTLTIRQGGILGPKVQYQWTVLGRDTTTIGWIRTSVFKQLPIAYKPVFVNTSPGRTFNSIIIFEEHLIEDIGWTNARSWASGFASDLILNMDETVTKNLNFVNFYLNGPTAKVMSYDRTLPHDEVKDRILARMHAGDLLPVNHESLGTMDASLVMHNTEVVNFCQNGRAQIPVREHYKGFHEVGHCFFDLRDEKPLRKDSSRCVTCSDALSYENVFKSVDDAKQFIEFHSLDTTTISLTEFCTCSDGETSLYRLCTNCYMQLMDGGFGAACKKIIGNAFINLRGHASE